jgi:hypothetical protein
MGAMAFGGIGLLQLVVHDDGAPDASSWARYMEECRQWLQRAGGDYARMTALIVSDRGVPTRDQRAEFMVFLNGHQVRSALVSRSVLVRAVVASVNLFNPALRSFAPNQLSAALRHLQFPASRQKEVLAALQTFAPRIPTAVGLRELLDAEQKNGSSTASPSH